MLRAPLTILILCLWLVAAVEAAILFDTQHLDLGFIYRDEPQKMVFAFLNRSSDSLRIVNVEPSCDCTTAQVLPDAVEPHGRGEVLVLMDPMGYEGRGRVTEHVRVFTTDLTEPEVLLTFSIEVGIGPEPEPRSLLFGKICKGESDSLPLLIHPGSDGPLGVLEAFSDSACVAVEQVGRDDDGTYELLVVISNKGNYGRLSTFITVVTTDSSRQRIRVPITASLVGNVIAEPDILTFGPTLPGNYVAQTVKVSAAGDLKLGPLKATSSVGGLDPQVNSLGENSYELRLKINEDAQPGRVMGEITIDPGCKDEPSLTIKVAGYVRSKSK